MQKPAIYFFSESIKYILKHKKILRNWIFFIINNENKIPGIINYIFCDDSYLLKINKEYLKHNTYTDIITFNHSENNNEISGDIYISIERIRKNAKKLNITTTNELYRVMIHGILHLIGYDDKQNNEKNQMRLKEDYCLSLLPKLSTN